MIGFCRYETCELQIILYLFILISDGHFCFVMLSFGYYIHYLRRVRLRSPRPNFFRKIYWENTTNAVFMRHGDSFLRRALYGVVIVTILDNHKAVCVKRLQTLLSDLVYVRK